MSPVCCTNLFHPFFCSYRLLTLAQWMTKLSRFKMENSLLFFKSSIPRSHALTPWQTSEQTAIHPHTFTSNDNRCTWQKCYILENWRWSKHSRRATSGLDDYRPVALVPVSMKCTELLVPQSIKAQIPPDLDRQQLVYRSKWSTRFLHSTLSRDVRTVFVDLNIQAWPTDRTLKR